MSHCTFSFSSSDVSFSSFSTMTDPILAMNAIINNVAVWMDALKLNILLRAKVTIASAMHNNATSFMSDDFILHFLQFCLVVHGLLLLILQVLSVCPLDVSHVCGNKNKKLLGMSTPITNTHKRSHTPITG